MPTVNQLVSFLSKIKNRVHKSKKGTRSRLLVGFPQRRGICFKIGVLKPKKPNSAKRKIAKVRLPNSKRRLICYIPGQGGFELRNYSQVLIRGGFVPDLPGIQYRLIRGKCDLTWQETFTRKNRRSKFGVPKVQTNLLFK